MRHDQRHDYIEDHGLPAWTPGADAYIQRGVYRGTPLFINRANQASFYEHFEQLHGVKHDVNPDGGIPHGEEMIRLRADERYQAYLEKRRKARKKRFRSIQRGDARRSSTERLSIRRN